MTMDESDLRAYQDYLKEAISLALTLSKNKNPTIYELGHYLADNVLAKVCMVIAKKNDRNDLIFKNGKNGYTHNFDFLYKNIIEKYYPKLPEYELTIKKYHEDRGFYQHHFESLKKIFRPSEAKKYVDFVIDVMRKTGILEKYENLPPTNIYSGGISQTPYLPSKQQRYQKFYDTLKNTSDENRVNAIYVQIMSLRVNIERDFNMIFKNNRWTKFFRNAYWNIDIHDTILNIHNQKKTEKIYSSGHPNENLDVLNEFLDYYRKVLKSLGIEIKE